MKKSLEFHVTECGPPAAGWKKSVGSFEYMGDVANSVLPKDYLTAVDSVASGVRRWILDRSSHTGTRQGSYCHYFKLLSLPSPLSSNLEISFSSCGKWTKRKMTSEPNRI